jgi:hypothetical protein
LTNPPRSRRTGEVLATLCVGSNHFANNGWKIDRPYFRNEGTTMVRVHVAMIAVLVMLAMPPVAHGNTQIGFGLTECTQYNQFRDKAPDLARGIDAWVLGYLSGVNFMLYTVKGVDLLKDQSAPEILSFVQGYCRSSPARSVANAANEFWFTLAGQGRK